MHNSQNGTRMVGDPVAGAAAGGDCQGCHNEARENMLTLTCIGCHAKNATTGPNIADPVTLDIPQVFFREADPDLAAGNFSYMVSKGDASGHNVHGWGLGTAGSDLIQPDLDLSGPPGYVEAMDPSGFNFVDDYPFGFNFGGQVMCAGAYGCHGNRTIESQSRATYGSHHANDVDLKFGTISQGTQAQSPGTSYRFLSGVQGGEDDDWEATVGPTDHNEYYGIDVAARSSQSEVATMSEFCASCHGNFHMAGLSDGQGIDSGSMASPWIRHPTDFEIPDTAPYNNYTSYMQAASGDRQTVRVARVTIPATASDQTGITAASGGPGEGIVFCLSCHKAHASQYEDMLRFSYRAMVTEQNNPLYADTGCFACHNDKDGI
jgi:hypothetical protein